MTNKKLEILQRAYAEMNQKFKRYKRKNTPNNKLKMKGEPMRRKGI